MLTEEHFKRALLSTYLIAAFLKITEFATFEEKQE